MQHYAFTEEQAEFLNNTAPARPSLWRYECERAIVHAHKNNELSVVKEAIHDRRWYLKRGLINMPPEWNLDQYCTPVLTVCDRTSATTWSANVSRRGDDGNVIIDFLPFAGSDARAWLHAAYRNAKELIQHADELLKLCDDLSNEDFEFVLDPPELASDPLEAAITPLLKHFANMTERQVLDVFRVGSGELRMSTTTLWIAACVVEAIRKGLGLQPASVGNVKVVCGSEGVAWRVRDSHNKARNVMYENCNGANEKSLDGYDQLHLELEPVQKELELLGAVLSNNNKAI